MSHSTLRASTQPLSTAYDTALVDLDGVVYVGPDAVPGAAEALTAARANGMTLAFVTNNASRTPQAVAKHLTELGVTATADEVVTSSMAVVHLLAEALPAGARVLVVGGDGLRTAVTDAGFSIVDGADAAAAVVQGYTPQTGWPALAEAALAVARGVPWIAANLDTTLPTPRGLVPGNGALVAAVTAATGRLPIGAGKPELPLHEEAVRRTGARRPLVVGDRLDTDIAGAVRARCPSLLVLTGVTDARQLLAAPAPMRPTYLASSLDGLNSTHPEVRVDDTGASCGIWRADRRGQRIDVRPTVPPGEVASADRLDALRAAVAAAWLDAAGPVTVHGDTTLVAEFALD